MRAGVNLIMFFIGLSACSVPDTQSEFDRQDEAYETYNDATFLPMVIAAGVAPQVGFPLIFASGVAVQPPHARVNRQQRRNARKISNQAEAAPAECQPLQSADGEIIGIPTSSECEGYYD